MSDRTELNDQISFVDDVISEFEIENPELASLMNTLGFSIDEYERIASGMDGFEFVTSSTSG